MNTQNNIRDTFPWTHCEASTLEIFLWSAVNNIKYEIQAAEQRETELVGEKCEESTNKKAAAQMKDWNASGGEFVK